MTMKTYRCECGYEMDAAALLDSGKGFFPSTAAIGGDCAKCGASTVFVVRSSKISWGYIYAAGSAHFEVMGEINAPGIVGKRKDDGFIVKLKGRIWTFEGPTESFAWIFLFQGFHAIGKTVSALKLDELSVRATEIQRNWKPIALDKELVLEQGDRLLLAGRHSALCKAQERLKSG